MSSNRPKFGSLEEGNRRSVVPVVGEALGENLKPEDNMDDNYYDEADDFVWDSIYVWFDVKVFLHQFILHLFLPISTWMSPSPRAQMMWFAPNSPLNEKMAVIVLFFLNTTSLFSVFIYEFLPEKDYDHFFGAIAYPLIFNVMWKLSVAIKYAMFSPSEYKRILTFKSWQTNENYSKQTLINRNLLSEQNDHVNRFEIAAGGHRCGIKNMHSVFFQIRNPNEGAEAKRQLDDWHTFLTSTTPVLTKSSGKLQKNHFGLDPSTHGTDGDDGYHFDLHRQSDGSYKITMFDLCRHLQQYAHKEALAEIGKMVELPGNCGIILVSLIPYFGIIDGSVKVSSLWTIMFLVFTTFDCLVFLRTIVTRFMNGAIIDYRRQYIIQRAFNDLIRISDYDGTINVSFNSPLTTSSNKKNDTASHRENVSRYMDSHALQDFHTMRKVESKKRILRTSMKGGLLRDGGLLRGAITDLEGGVGGDLAGGTRGVRGSADEEKLSDRRRPVTLPPLRPTNAAQSPAPSPFFDGVQEGRPVNNGDCNKNNDTVEDDHLLSSQAASFDSHTPTDFHDSELDGKGYVKVFYDNSEIVSSCRTPRICLGYEGNIFSWMQARQVMSTFKVRFRRRIEAVAALVMLFTMAMIGACFVVIFRADDTLAIYTTPLVLQTIVVVTVFGVTLIKYASEAAKINTMFEKHLYTVRLHQVMLRAHIIWVIRNAVRPHGACHIAHAAAVKKAELDSKLRYEGLEACANYLETSNKFQPCEVFGVHADMRLVGTVMSGLLTFYVSLVSIFYSSGGLKKTL